MSKSEAQRTKRDNAVLNYLNETRAELRKVHWPSQQEARMLTTVVLAVTVVMAAFLGFADFLNNVLNNISKHSDNQSAIHSQNEKLNPHFFQLSHLFNGRRIRSSKYLHPFVSSNIQYSRECFYYLRVLNELGTEKLNTD